MVDSVRKQKQEDTRLRRATQLVNKLLNIADELNAIRYHRGKYKKRVKQ